MYIYMYKNDTNYISMNVCIKIYSYIFCFFIVRDLSTQDPGLSWFYGRGHGIGAIEYKIYISIYKYVHVHIAIV